MYRVNFHALRSWPTWNHWNYDETICTEEMDHTCSQNVHDLTAMSEGHTVIEVTTHKEEMPFRIRLNQEDREKVREMLQSCIDPLDPADHSDRVINIVTARIGPEKVNVPNAVEIERTQMRSYEESWPEGFNATLSKEVVTMAVTRKVLRVGATAVFDINLIYSRVIGMQQSHDIKLSDVLQNELAPVPASIFAENGEIRIAKTKATLKKNLQVETSSRLAPQPDVTIIDGCAILWVIHWSNSGTVLDFVDSFTSFIFGKAERYYIYLQAETADPAPTQKVVLTLTENKIQLIEIICHHLITASQQGKPTNHRLVITGQESSPTENHRGLQRRCDDLKMTNEEANVIMIQQVDKVANDGVESIKVLCGDTDVFILLVYHFTELQCSLTMESNFGSNKVQLGTQ